MFHLARRLKTLAPKHDPLKLLTIVKEWHRRALPVIRTKLFSETWSDFLIAWERIRKPTDSDSFRQMVESASEMPIPASAAHHDDPRILHLIRICAALQQSAGDATFFLACRTAGELIGASKSDANRMLRTLCAEGIIQLIRRGSKRTQQASEYKYYG